MLSSVALVVGQFLAHTHGLVDWGGGAWPVEPYYVYGSQNGWEWGSWWVAVPAIGLVALSIGAYLLSPRRWLLRVALLTAILAALWALLDLWAIPADCGPTFFQMSCPPHLDALRWIAPGAYVTLAAPFSLACACLALLRSTARPRDPARSAATE